MLCCEMELVQVGLQLHPKRATGPKGPAEFGICKGNKITDASG